MYDDKDHNRLVVGSKEHPVALADDSKRNSVINSVNY